MTEEIEAKPYSSKSGRIHYSYISGRKVRNHIEYTKETEVPKELIKFYSITQNSVDAVTKGFLWATNPSDFNDPFDCPIQLWNNISPSSEFREVIKKFIGIICLHEFSLNDQDILWGYYTDQKGFAIKFSSYKLVENWGNPFKVEYLEMHELDHFNLPSIKEDIFPMILRWGTQKKHIWKNENEWRFIFSNLKIETLKMDTFKEERQKLYHPSFIEEIILGLKFFNNTNMVEVSKHDSYYIIQGEQHKIQNELLEFLSFPSEIPVKHMYMKVDELIMTPRPCKIFNLSNGRFKIHYLLASEEEYKLALKRLDEIFDSLIGTPESDEANELALLIDEFEQAHYPIDGK